MYSLLIGMSVPDVSGKAIANLEIESLRHVAPTFHGDTIYGETRCWEVGVDQQGRPRDRPVETRGSNQDGTLVCMFRRKVIVPKQSYLDARGGDQPGRPPCASSPHLSGERHRRGGADFAPQKRLTSLIVVDR